MLFKTVRWVLAHQFFCQNFIILFFGRLVCVAVSVGVMFQKNKITDIIKPVAESAAEEYGCRVIGVFFKKEKDGNILRITVDGNKITLDICADISTKISEWLDANEKNIPFAEYVLEVTSPGPDRALTTKEDFERFINNTVLIVTKSKAADGRKKYLGKIKEVTDTTVKIYVEKESAEFTLELNDIAKTRLEYLC